MNPIVVIPARMASTRLPGKPLADIHGKPMIVHVLDRAREADIGPVAVACAEAEIADAVADQLRRLSAYSTFGSFVTDTTLRLADRVAAIAPINPCWFRKRPGKI